MQWSGKLLAVVVVACGTTVLADEALSPLAVRTVEVLDAGFQRGSSALREAQSRYESARSAQDPRLDYAFGLVLLRQLKNKDALAQFQSITRSHPEYWPAWQGAIWLSFVSRDQSAGLVQLKDLARALQRSKQELPQREPVAEWIGQVLAALQKTVETIKQRELLQREDEAIVAVLGDDFRDAVARGRATVHAVHAALEEDVQLTREQVEEKQARERAEREAQVARDLEESAERRENLKKTSEQWKEYLDQRVAECDRQLTRLEKDYDVLQQRVLALNTVQVQINTELAFLDQQGNDQSNPRAIEQRKAALGVQLLRSQVDLEQSLAGAMLVAQRAQATVMQKSQAIQQYEKATGQLVQKDAGLDKWQDRLKKQGEKLKTPPKGKATPVANRIQQLRSFRTYVDLDPALERGRLMESFSP